MISRGASIAFMMALLLAIPIMLGAAIYHSLRMRPLIWQIAAVVGLLLVGLPLLRSDPDVTFTSTLGFFLGSTAYIAAFLLLLFGRPGSRPSYRQLFFPTAKRLGPWLLVCSAVGIALFFLVFFGRDAASAAGQKFLNTGTVDRPWGAILNIRSDKVSITPVDQDILKVCDGRHNGYLLGRPDDSVFVLLVPSTKEASAGLPAVVRLANEHYKIVPKQDAVACKAVDEKKTTR